MSGPHSSFPVEWGTVDSLAKGCAHVGIKTIGVKTMDNFSHFCHRPLQSEEEEKEKEEEEEEEEETKRWNRIARCPERLRT